MRFVARLLLRLLCLPADVPGWAFTAVVALVWGWGIRVHRGILLAELRPRTWLGSRWSRKGGGVTFGHAIVCSPGFAQSAEMWAFQLRRVEDFEASCVHGGLIAGAAMALLVAGPRWVFLGLIGLAGFNGLLAYLSTALANGLRGQDFYRARALVQETYDAIETRKR